MTSKEREENTAYHEAGHAVLTVFLGLRFLKVTIVPESDSLGHVLHRKYSKRFWEAVEFGLSPHMHDLLERIIKALIAGGIAERIASGRSNHVGSRCDWENVGTLMSRIYEMSSPEFRLYSKLKLMETEGMVRLYWEDIEAIKDALRCRKTMTSQEVRDILLPGLAKAKVGKRSKVND